MTLKRVFTTRLLAGVAIVLASATCASADVTWNFNDVNFYLASWDPTSPNDTRYTEVASLSGYFSTNNAATTVTDFSHLAITAELGYSTFAFDIAGMVDDYLPDTIGIYSAGWGSYIDLELTNPLTGAGGVHSFSAGYDCPGCAVLLPNGNSALVGEGGDVIAIREEVASAPEPGFYVIFAIGLVGLGFAVRRKRMIA